MMTKGEEARRAAEGSSGGTGAGADEMHGPSTLLERRMASKQASSARRIVRERVRERESKRVREAESREVNATECRGSHGMAQNWAFRPGG